MKATIGGHYLWPIHKLIPEYYYTEAITGIFLSTPFVLLAIIPCALFHKKKTWLGDPRRGDDASNITQQDKRELTFIAVTLYSVSISLIAPLLFFVDTSMRHLTDVIPILLILSTLGMWIGFYKVQNSKPRRWVFSFLVWGITLYSAVTGFLLSVTGYHARFENLNPELFDRLTRFFTW
jgi:hypothetical protein